MPNTQRVRITDNLQNAVARYRTWNRFDQAWEPWTSLVHNLAVGDYSRVEDDKHQWPPEKGSYVGGNFYRTRVVKAKAQSAIVAGPIPLKSGVIWGPQEIEGNVSIYVSVDRGKIPDYLADDRELMSTSVINKAFSKAYSSKATLLVTAAELHKSIGMVKKPFGQAVNLLAQMTRRYRNLLYRGMKAADAATSAWLEYRLGWKPILYDLENIAKATHQYLSEIDQSYDETFRSKLTQEWEGTGQGVIGQDGPSSFSGGTYHWWRQLEAKVAAGVILRQNLFDEKSRPFQQIFGMQLHDVAPAVWELMPYSFVVDRFVEVQTWLEAIQPRPNTKVMFSWVTTVTNTWYKGSFNLLYVLGDGTVCPLSNPITSDSEDELKITRQVGVTPSIYPSLNVKALKLNQHVDHASLIYKQLVGLFPEVTHRTFGRTRTMYHP